MSTLANRYFTPEEYLKLEREAPYKSEYYEGVIYAMAGARRAHNLIATNTIRELSQGVRSRPCEVYGSDMRVRTGSGLYAYPDAIVVCGKPELLDEAQDTLLNPLVLVEVLSQSTEAYDRGKKFELYRSIPSFREYILLASDRIHADLYVREAKGQWLLTSVGNLSDELFIESIGCRLHLADLYEKVQFEALS